MTRDPFARYRDRLAGMGFQPSRRWGQNFLLDPTLHRFIAEQAELDAEDLAVEVGVGLGFLTRELAVRAGAVLGVEIDSRLLRVARDELAPWPNVTLLEGDVMAAAADDGAALLPAFVSAIEDLGAGRPAWRLVANLPYKVSGPFLGEVTTLPRLPRRAVCLVQEELAERLAAGPGTKEFGGLSTVVQASFRARVVRKVGPQVFRPRPRVGSAILVLDRRDGEGAAVWPAAARLAFSRFVRALFQHRRKRLGTQWPRALAASGATDGLGCPPSIAELRPDALSADALSRWWLESFGAGQFGC